MNLFILLQDSASSLSLTLKEVVFLIGGISSILITVVTNNLTTKSKIEKVATKNESDHQLARQTVESLKDELKEIKVNFDQLEKNIGTKLDEVSTGLNKMAVGFESFKGDIYKMLLQSKGGHE